MNKLICYSCGHGFEHEMLGSYPCGPCPTNCPNCHASCCPQCGGELGKSVDGGKEMDQYTAGGCHSCNYTCCGGCI